MNLFGVVFLLNLEFCFVNLVEILIFSRVFVRFFFKGVKSCFLFFWVFGDYYRLEDIGGRYIGFLIFSIEC